MARPSPTQEKDHPAGIGPSGRPGPFHDLPDSRRQPRSELEHGSRTYDYLVVNDSVDTAYAELEAIVTAERHRRERMDLGALGLESPKQRGS